jgi:hypothetical protein
VDDVVGLAVCGWAVAVGVAAAFVAQVDCDALGDGDGSGGAADVERHAGRAEQDGDDFAVTSDAAQVGDRQGAAAGEVTDADPVAQVGFGGGDDEVGFVGAGSVAGAEVERLAAHFG